MGAPTVGSMMADILPYLGVEADYSVNDLVNMDRSVPNLVGRNVAEAMTQLTGQNLAGRVIGTGDTVTMQLPAPGSVVAGQSQILLYADSEGSGDLEEVPDLTGLTYDVARQRLGFYALYLNTDNTFVSDAETATVLRQSIEPGTQAEHGTIVTVSLNMSNESTNART